MGNELSIIVLQKQSKVPISANTDVKTLTQRQLLVERRPDTGWFYVRDSDYLVQQATLVETLWVPYWNFALCLDGIIQIDKDPRAITDIFSVEFLLNQLDGLLDWVKVGTANGGQHWYARIDPNNPIHQRLRHCKLLDGLALRTGATSYGVIPPSKVVNLAGALSDYGLLNGDLLNIPKLTDEAAYTLLDYVKPEKPKQDVSHLPPSLQNIANGTAPLPPDVLDSLPEHLNNLDPDLEYPEWFTVLAGVAHQVKDSSEEEVERARAMVESWSSKAKTKWDAYAFARTWQDAVARANEVATPVTIKSVLKMSADEQSRRLQARPAVNNVVQITSPQILKERRVGAYYDIFRAFNPNDDTELITQPKVTGMLSGSERTFIAPTNVSFRALTRWLNVLPVRNGFEYFSRKHLDSMRAVIDPNTPRDAAYMRINLDRKNAGPNKFCELVFIELAHANLHKRLGIRNEKELGAVFKAEIGLFLQERSTDEKALELSRSQYLLQAIMDTVPKWDGVNRAHEFEKILLMEDDSFSIPDCDTWKSLLFRRPGPDGQPGTGSVFFIMMLNWIRRALHTQEEGVFLPVLLGDTGIGKTTFVTSLMCGKNTLVESPLHVALDRLNKDLLRGSTRTFTVGSSTFTSKLEDIDQKWRNSGFIEAAEIAGFIRNAYHPMANQRLREGSLLKMETLKDRITNATPDLTGKYAIAAQFVNDLFLVGTGNIRPGDDLKPFWQACADTRRFIPVPVDKVDTDYLNTIWEQLWAQALYHALTVPKPYNVKLISDKITAASRSMLFYATCEDRQRGVRLTDVQLSPGVIHKAFAEVELLIPNLVNKRDTAKRDRVVPAWFSLLTNAQLLQTQSVLHPGAGTDLINLLVSKGDAVRYKGKNETGENRMFPASALPANERKKKIWVNVSLHITNKLAQDIRANSALIEGEDYAILPTTNYPSAF